MIHLDNVVMSDLVNCIQLRKVSTAAGPNRQTQAPPEVFQCLDPGVPFITSLSLTAPLAPAQQALAAWSIVLPS